MDENYKRSVQKKHRQQVKKQRSREELRLIKENSKGRRTGKNSRGGRGRVEWRNPKEDNEDTNFESMRPAPQLDLAKAKQQAQAAKAAQEGATISEAEELEQGLVLTVFKDRIRVSGDGDDHFVMLSPTGPKPAVGDTAFWKKLEADHKALIRLGERRTVLSRPDPQVRHKALVLAANVDLAVIVASAKAPNFRPGLIDRCLIAIWHGGATPVVCLNKIDLVDKQERESIRLQLEAYRQLGISVILTSTETDQGIPDLMAELSGKTCVLLGHSGVGKSSLLNAIDPLRERRTNQGREFDGKGRHTTTASELVELEDGTRLIDTPGVRSFGLWEIQGSEVQSYFPDLVDVASSCRYRDCTHLTEPDCAVPSAIKAGQLVEARFDAYKRIRASLEA